MNFLRKILGFHQKKNNKYDVDLWVWFAQHAAEFYRVIKSNSQVDVHFLEKIMPRLQSMNSQFYCLVGMLDNETAELIITAEGDIKSFVFVEELVARAPSLAGWKFTALKPRPSRKSLGLKMNGYRFDNDNIRFYYNEDAQYPDNINISLLYDGYTEENADNIHHGCLLFLENTLGELNIATQIDEIGMSAECPAGKEPIPIHRLEDFLMWREKELIEKYEGTRHETNNDTYSILEGGDNDGLPLVAVINRNILEWEAKASHPWMMVVEIGFDGKGRNGMPHKDDASSMDLLEDMLVQQLPDSEGYLNLGRQTYNGKRTIFFACKEFRRSSKTAAALISEYQGALALSYDIYKDKYWTTMNSFRAAS